MKQTATRAEIRAFLVNLLSQNKAVLGKAYAARTVLFDEDSPERMTQIYIKDSRPNQGQSLCQASLYVELKCKLADDDQLDGMEQAIDQLLAAPPPDAPAIEIYKEGVSYEGADEDSYSILLIDYTIEYHDPSFPFF